MRLQRVGIALQGGAGVFPDFALVVVEVDILNFGLQPFEERSFRSRGWVAAGRRFFRNVHVDGYTGFGLAAGSFGGHRVAVVVCVGNT